MSTDPIACKAAQATELFANEALVKNPVLQKHTLPTTNKDFRRLYANQAVHHWCRWATVAGFVPIPVVDVLTISAAQAKMVHSLCQIYDKQFEFDYLRLTWRESDWPCFSQPSLLLHPEYSTCWQHAIILNATRRSIWCNIRSWRSIYSAF